VIAPDNGAIDAAQYRLLTWASARLLGLARAETTIDGVRVPYFVRGSREPLVLVHGFASDKESWLFLAGALERGRSLVIPDLPGYGEAGAIPPERASAGSQAAVLAALLDALGHARADIAGTSMGGAIALRFAHDYPARTRSLTLIGSIGPVVEKSAVARALERGENPLVVAGVQDFARLMSLVCERPPPIPRPLRRHLARDRSRRREALLGIFRAWQQAEAANTLTPAALGDIRAPALVLHGARDRVVDPSTSKALARHLPGADLRILEGVGHAPPIEAPRTVARHMQAFFRNLADPS
jgi:pimeloyl-ACP methyl ester carboxylesterase